MRGTIKLVNSRGFGFISHKGIDFFFHYTDFKGNWKPLVQSFIIAEEKKSHIEVEFDHDTSSTDGPKAINVKLYDANAVNSGV